MSKKNNEMIRYFSGIDEVELTEELIDQLQIKFNMPQKHVDQLRHFKKLGAKWNTHRNSVVFPIDFF